MNTNQNKIRSWIAGGALMLVSGLSMAEDIPPQYDCPAGRLAVARQQAIIQREMNKIEGLKLDSQAASDDITKCLGSLAIDLKIPTFPTLGGIIDKIKKEACNLARNKTQGEIDKIKNKYGVPDSIDPWGEAMKQIPQTDYNQYIPSPSKDKQNLIDLNSGKEAEPIESDAFPWSIN